MAKWVSRAVFVLISLGCAGLMVDSYTWNRWACIQEEAGVTKRYFRVRSHNGALGLEIQRFYYSRLEDQPRRLEFTNNSIRFVGRMSEYESSLPDWISFGAASFDVPSMFSSGTSSGRSTFIWMPLWFVFLLTPIPLAFIYRSIRREKRFASGTLQEVRIRSAGDA